MSVFGMKLCPRRFTENMFSEDGQWMTRETLSIVVYSHYYCGLRRRKSEPPLQRSNCEALCQEAVRVVQAEAQEWQESIIIICTAVFFLQYKHEGKQQGQNDML